MATHLITGGAGFVGVNLIPRLLERGHSVLIVDDMSRGSWRNLALFQNEPRVAVETADCADLTAFRNAVCRYAARPAIDEVWHLAANSDIPAGVAEPRVDLSRTFLTTFNTLLVMRELEVGVLHFSSTSAIYGDLGSVELHEDIGPLQPISNYGAMKLASEAQIRAAVEAYLGRADIFRFPNVVGTPATHGVMLDFVRKLKNDPTRLSVLGDGTQRKSYLHVDDLVDAMLFVADKASERYSVYNIGPNDDGVLVSWIAETVCDAFGAHAQIEYGTDRRGWVGDVPRFSYSTARLRKLGWSPRLTSREAIKRAAQQIVEQERQ